MADSRIRVAKDKAKLVKALRDSEGSGPFQSYADVMIFSAALGIRHGRRVPLQVISKEIDPIRQDIFHGKGYEQVINLIAVVDTGTPKAVGTDEASELKRIEIFEEYANGGLEVLSEALKGVIDYSDCVLLMLVQERNKTPEDEDSSFDLKRLML